MTEPHPGQPQLGPVQSQERVILLDVLRAFAILGMFYANWTGMLHPDVANVDGVSIQNSVAYLLGRFVHGKFYPLFAILMGVGIGIQIERADTRRAEVIPVLIRRMFSLYFLAWLGGLVLPIFHLLSLAAGGLVATFIGYTLRRHRFLLLGVIVWLFLANAIPMALRSYERGPRAAATPEQVEQRYERSVTRFERESEEATNVHSPFYEMERARRSVERLFSNPIPGEFRSLESLVTGFHAELTLFMLVGLFLWQVGLFKPSWTRRRFWYLLLFSGIVGLGASSGVDVLYLLVDETPFLSAVVSFFWTFLELGVDLAYIAAFGLLLSTGWSARVLKKLAPAGHMAFTNYVLHKALPPVLFLLLFGWWLPGIGHVEAMIKVTIVFALLVIFSTWWLNRFRFGPFEWLWRSLTYWKLQPMRVERTVAAD
jgi:uncharacterized protein